jgi:exodeoxyribonuclease VII large subunit
MEQVWLELGPVRQVYTVAQLNARIRSILDAQFGDLWVSGEISGVRLAPSGHYYFTLKDGDSQIRCACFRMNARYLKFKPQDGVAVIARGHIDVYEARGEYQLLVEHLEPQGLGALQFAFEQLKTKLAAEGLFDGARKRPLPKLPRRIGIVTSPAGAVIQDMLNVLSRRFPGLWIRLYPALVQGEGSVEQVRRGIRYFSESEWAEVVIVARGGGSLEDLWTFNEESVARAIAACPVPVISAVGHETDFTIADFVADLRAPTPSAAAELVICTREQLLEGIEGCRNILQQQMRYRLSMAARSLHERGIDRAVTSLHRRIGRQIQAVDELERCASEALRRQLRDRQDKLRDFEARLRHMAIRLRFSESRRKLDTLDADARRHIRQRLNRAAAEYRPLAAQLGQLSPLKVLERGYAIVQTTDGHVIKAAAEAPAGTPLQVRLSAGRLEAVVTSSSDS